MGLTFLPIGRYAGLYDTITENFGYYFSPLIIYPDGRITMAGQEIVYSYNAVTTRLTFDWEIIAGQKVQGDFEFTDQNVVLLFTGTLTTANNNQPLVIKGVLQGMPLSYWIGHYETETGSLGSVLSPLIVHPTGEITISGDRIEYTYNLYKRILRFDWCQIGNDSIKGELCFSDKDGKDQINGVVTFKSSGKTENCLGFKKGMPLSFWAMYYNTDTQNLGDFYSPFIVHNNDTLDIAGQRINFTYNPQYNNLVFEWQDIKTVRTKGSITFSRNLKINNFDGYIITVPNSIPYNYTGQANQMHTVTISNKRSKPIRVYSVDAKGDMVLSSELEPGEGVTKDAYQGQYFIAKENYTVISGYYAYPGLKAWNLTELESCLLPSLESDQRITLNIINHISMYLELYKIDADGNPIFHTTIPAKKQIHQLTTENSQWMVMQQGKIIDKFFAVAGNKTWIINGASHSDFGADIPALIGSLSAPYIPSYNVGLGDFTVSATVKPISNGVVISRLGSSAEQRNGAFFIGIDQYGAIIFTTHDGTGFYEVSTGDTEIFDGEYHTIAGVRASGNLYISLDGTFLSVKSFFNKNTPLNIDNNGPMTICKKLQKEKGYSGVVMNVGFWRCALSESQLRLVMFGVLEGQENNLAAFWSLNYDLDDASENRNRLTCIGNIGFVPVFHCVWAYGENNYAFCQIENPQNDLVDPTQITRKQVITVKEGTHALYAGIIDNSMCFTIPEDVALLIEDPTGQKFQQDISTDTLFVKTKGNRLGALAVINPKPGEWKISITAFSNKSYHFQMQTAPIRDVVNTTLKTLGPYFSTPTSYNYSSKFSYMSKNMTRLSWGWLECVASIAVMAIAFVAAVPTAGTSLVVAATVVAALNVSTIAATAYLECIDSEKEKAIEQSKGTGGYTKSNGTILLIDANVKGDTATEIIYRRRSKKLYPYVASSKFSSRYSSLIEADDVPDKVNAALNQMNLSYCSASGHGRPAELYGWAKDGGTGAPLPEVINTKVTRKQAENKVFHFFACNCGYDSDLGIGANLVSKGAKAFFGYKDRYIMPINSRVEFCDCDMEIDKALIDGDKAETAYNRSIQLYNQKINRFKADADYNSAAVLEKNMNNLVSPSIGARFGNKDATI